VYNKAAGKAVDVVTFDTFSDSFPCSRTQEVLPEQETYGFDESASIELTEYKKSHRLV